MDLEVAKQKAKECKEEAESRESGSGYRSDSSTIMRHASGQSQTKRTEQKQAKKHDVGNELMMQGQSRDDPHVTAFWG